MADQLTRANETTTGDRFRQLVSGLLQLLEPARESAAGGASAPTRLILETVRSELVRGLEGGIRGLATELRRELPGWLAAAEHLDRLEGSRFLSGCQAAQDLRQHLKLAEMQATRLLEALEALTRGSAAPSAPPVLPSPKPRNDFEEPLLAQSRAAVNGRAEGRRDSHPIPIPATPETVANHAALECTREERPLPLDNGGQKRGAAGTRRPSVPRPAEPPHPEPAAPPPPATPPPRPAAPQAAPSQEAKRGGQMVVACPRCGCTGTVNVNHLDRMLLCKGCSERYKVGSDGQMVALIQTRDGKWVEAARHRSAGLRVPRRMAVAGLVLFLLPATLLLSRSAARPPEQELPRELKPRAEMAARAWLSKDLPLLRRLSDPKYERSVFAWLRRQPPPQTLSAEEASRVQLEVIPRPKVGQTADVVVRFRSLRGARKGTLDLILRWQEREGVWFFLPPSR